jgi:cell division protein FtsL
MLESTAVYMKDKILSLQHELTEARAQIAAKDAEIADLTKTLEDYRTKHWGKEQ